MCNTPTGFKAWFSNPRTAGRLRSTSLYCAARGHFCKLCMYQKKFHSTLVREVYHLLLLFPHAVREPAYSKGVALCRERFGDPCLKVLAKLVYGLDNYGSLFGWTQNLCFRHGLQKESDIHNTPLTAVNVAPSRE